MSFQVFKPAIYNTLKIQMSICPRNPRISQGQLYPVEGVQLKKEGGRKFRRNLVFVDHDLDIDTKVPTKAGIRTMSCQPRA